MRIYLLKELLRKQFPLPSQPHPQPQAKLADEQLEDQVQATDKDEDENRRLLTTQNMASRNGSPVSAHKGKLCLTPTGLPSTCPWSPWSDAKVNLKLRPSSSLNKTKSVSLKALASSGTPTSSARATASSRTPISSRETVPKAVSSPSLDAVPTEAPCREINGTPDPDLNVNINLKVGIKWLNDVKDSNWMPKIDTETESDGGLTDERDGHPNAKGEALNIIVGVRLRPFIQKEAKDVGSKRVVFVDEEQKSIYFKDTDNQVYNNVTFPFHEAFDSFDQTSPSHADQSRVYERMGRPLLDHALLGYNVCLFAYGQTASGKTFSLMGTEADAGIIVRFVGDLFQKLGDKPNDVMISLTYLEIYNEKIHNLLTPDNGNEKVALKIREHPSEGPYVVNLQPVTVQTLEDLLSWLSFGNLRRETAATAANERSSRSHAMVTITISQNVSAKSSPGERGDAEFEERLVSKVNLVDLAGSERASSQSNGDRQKEGASINKSLLTLGKVISALSEKASRFAQSSVYVPYRESTLTWLLKESLGGNSRTSMLATISPTYSHLEQTVSTLRYASKAKGIVNKVHINEDAKSKRIRSLLAEVEVLKQQLKAAPGAAASAVVALPLATEVIEVHVIPSGEAKGCSKADVGWETELADSLRCQLVLSGDGQLKVTHNNEAEGLTTVNGVEVDKETILGHGDRLVFGNKFSSSYSVDPSRASPHYLCDALAKMDFIANQQKQLIESMRSGADPKIRLAARGLDFRPTPSASDLMDDIKDLFVDLLNVSTLAEESTLSYEDASDSLSSEEKEANRRVYFQETIQYISASSNESNL